MGTVPAAGVRRAVLRRPSTLVGLCIAGLLLAAMGVWLVMSGDAPDSEVVPVPVAPPALEGDDPSRGPRGLDPEGPHTGSTLRGTQRSSGAPLPRAPQPAAHLESADVADEGTRIKGPAAASVRDSEGSPPPPQAPAVDEDLPPYARSDALQGELRLAGSDTLNNLLISLSNAFTVFHPDVTVHIESHGSATGPPALVAGVVDLAAMVREMTPRESTSFSEKFGYASLGVRIAFEALAVLVHPTNPIDRLSMAQLDAMFSTTRKRGMPTDITTWGALGVVGSSSDRRIELFGRNSASATYGWFKQLVLAKGDFKPSVREEPGSAAVRFRIENGPTACGYGPPTGTATDVRAVPIVAGDGRAVLPDPDEIRSGRYPISRPLWLYVNRRPGEPLPPNVRAFLLFTFSREGRNLIERSMLTPHSRATAEAERAKVL